MDGFRYLAKKFPGLLEAKLKEGRFVRTDIERLLADREFTNIMTDFQKKGWFVFKEVMENFFGDNKDFKYKHIVRRMLKSFEDLTCLMSLEVYLLQSHLNYFPENVGA